MVRYRETGGLGVVRTAQKIVGRGVVNVGQRDESGGGQVAQALLIAVVLRLGICSRAASWRWVRSWSSRISRMRR